MGKALKLISIGILFCVSLAMAILSSNSWHWFAAAALGFSWFGDAFLAHFEPFTRNMKNPFMVGMGMFALAQICYITSFWRSIQGMPLLRMAVPGIPQGMEVLLSVLPVYLLVGIFFWVLMVMRSNNPGYLKLGTLLYCLLLSTMGAFACAASFTGAFIAWPLMLGGILFIVSDGLIAAHEFAGRISNERRYDFFVWATYLPAQVLLFVGSSWLY